MKKHSQKAKMNKKRFLNKLGMTYVELLCALSLLSLIIVMFTPMLLSSYETVYKAGERVEEAYDSKEEIEEKLSTRIEESVLTFNKFSLESNANNALYEVEITGKKIVSSLTHGLETLFGVSKARVRIISPRVVYDDQNNHELIIQIKGLKYNKVTFGNFVGRDAFIDNNKNHTLKNGIVHVEVTIPKKELGVDESDVYTSDGAAKIEIRKLVEKELKYVEVSDKGEALTNSQNGGRIFLKISSATDTELDFTQSPVRIKVHYVDNRDKYRSTCDYLTIEPPTMLLAGEANANVDYYTSAGVVEKGGEYRLEVNPRKMRIDNSGALLDESAIDRTNAANKYVSSDNPGLVKNFDGTTGATIQTVTWVDTDENAQLNPYYVMAGKYSRVYRMYNYKKGTDITSVFPQSTVADNMDTKDNAIVLTDGTVATQSFWSGDMSDQYYFKTLEESSGYGVGDYVGTDCTQAQGDSDGKRREHKGTRYDYFDKTLRYSMSFNGFSTGYDYQHLANRRISYVLTEAGGGRSFRFAGRLKDGEFSDYSLPWEPAGSYYQGSGSRRNFDKKSWPNEDEYRNDDQVYIGIPRIIEGSNKSNDPFYTSHESPYEGPVYFEKYEDYHIIANSQNKHTDEHFAYIRLKSYISVDPIKATELGDESPDFVHRFNKGDFWWPEGYHEDPEAKKPVKNQFPNEHDWLSQNTANCVNVTSSAYLPDTGSEGQGQVIYFGTVPAYAFIEQGSDIGTADEPLSLHVFNGGNAIASRQTGYVVTGTQGEGTTIYRYFNVAEDQIDSVSDYFMNYWKKDEGTIETENNRATFYTYPKSDKALKYTDTNLEFTFGYCSRWRMAIGDVTSDGKREESRSYEKYYISSYNASAAPEEKLSYLTQKVTPKGKDQINNLGERNLYYNVWFPGEYYNLIHTATLDAITVAVGYAVSGSSFMKESAAWNSVYSDWGEKETGSNSEKKNGAYFGTALGSIYNDGVLAAYVTSDAGGRVYDGTEDDKSLDGKGERNVIFQNVLYYKTPKFIDKYTADNKEYCPKYLHARESVRFTAVDLYTVSPYDTSEGSGAATVAEVDGEKEYYAVYGDSRGKAFISKIATATFEEDTSGNQTSDTEEKVDVKEKVELFTGESAVQAKEDTDLSDDALNGMFEIKVNGATLDTIFNEIKTISIENDIMIITGSQKTTTTVEKFVVGTRSGDENNNWTFKIIDNGTFTDVVQSAKIIGGYYYICGNNGAGLNWVAAVSVDTLRNIPNGTAIANESKTDDKVACHSKYKDKLLWVKTDTKVFAFDGRDTRG